MRTRVKGRTATIELCRPHELNALRTEDLRSLRRALRSLYRSGVRVAVITGHGSVFCAGGEVPPGTSLLGYYRFLREFGRTMRTVERGPIVTIAAINGLTTCGGFELMLACDLVVVTRGAVVSDQHLEFGLHPGGGSTTRLPKLIGRRRALWHLIGGDNLDGPALVALGLAVDCVEPRHLLERAHHMAERIAGRDRRGVVSVSRCVRRSDLPAARVLERLAAARNARRLGASAADLRARRFEANRALVRSTQSDAVAHAELTLTTVTPNAHDARP